MCLGKVSKFKALSPDSRACTLSVFVGSGFSYIPVRVKTNCVPSHFSLWEIFDCLSTESLIMYKAECFCLELLEVFFILQNYSWHFSDSVSTTWILLQLFNSWKDFQLYITLLKMKQIPQWIRSSLLSISNELTSERADQMWVHDSSSFTLPPDPYENGMSHFSG